MCDCGVKLPTDKTPSKIKNILKTPVFTGFTLDLFIVKPLPTELSTGLYRLRPFYQEYGFLSFVKAKKLTHRVIHRPCSKKTLPKKSLG